MFVYKKKRKPSMVQLDSKQDNVGEVTEYIRRTLREAKKARMTLFHRSLTASRGFLIE